MMSDLEKLEARWAELRRTEGKPMSLDERAAETQEILMLAKQIEFEHAKAYSGLISKLSTLGIRINSIWDLVNTREKYPQAIPLLIEYLPSVENFREKEGFVRALTVREAKGLAVPALINEYKKAAKQHKSLRWAIGNAVNVTITKDYLDDVISIVSDNSNGESRQRFVTALGKFKTEKVKQVLTKRLNDENPVIKKEAIKILKKFK